VKTVFPELSTLTYPLSLQQGLARHTVPYSKGFQGCCKFHHRQLRQNVQTCLYIRYLSVGVEVFNLSSLLTLWPAMQSISFPLREEFTSSSVRTIQTSSRLIYGLQRGKHQQGYRKENRNSLPARTLNAAPETKSADLTILRTSRTIMYVPY